MHARAKALERRHARRMGTTRIWRKDWGESAPDGATHSDVWDCKYREEHAAVAVFVECEKKYRTFTGHRRFHTCLHDRRFKGDFVLVRAEEYARLVALEATE